MKKLLALLLAIFAVLTLAAFEQHQNFEQQKHERAEQVLNDCWEHAAANGGAGADLCKSLADEVGEGR